MSFRYAIEKNTVVETRRIAGEQVHKALAEIADDSLDRHLVIHQVRKRCKKIRSLLRLVRGDLNGVYRQENIRFRDIARMLSGLRDAQASIDCLEGLREYAGKGEFEELYQALVLRRDAAVADTEEIAAALDGVSGRLADAQEPILEWPLEQDGFALLSRGMKKTYRRGRKALHRAYENPNSNNFHDWRKRVKYHWYHTKLLQDIWPAMMGVRGKELKRLADLLGDEHDLAVLEETLSRKPGEFGPAAALEDLLALLHRRQQQLRSAARLLGKRIYAETATAHVRRLEHLWAACRGPSGI